MTMGIFSCVLLLGVCLRTTASGLGEARSQLYEILRAGDKGDEGTAAFQRQEGLTNDVQLVAGRPALCPQDCKTCELGGHTVISFCWFDPVDALTRIFAAYSGMSKLSVTHAHLSVLPRNLGKLTRLTSLDLQHNAIENIEWNDLRDLTALRNLSLRFNEITIIRNGSLHHFKKLRHIHFGNNQIDVIEPDAFVGLGKLKSVDVSTNKLTILDSWPFSLAKIMPKFKLYAEGNSIYNFTNLDGGSHLCLDSMDPEFHLERNNISHIRDVFTGWNIRLNGTNEIKDCLGGVYTKFFLDDNPLKCDCHDFDVYWSLHDYPWGGVLTCDSPPHLKSTDIRNVLLEELQCPVVNDCPGSCTCSNTPNSQTINVFCGPAYNGTKLPDILPELPKGYKYGLNFHYTQLDVFEEMSYSEDIKFAYLSHNRINHVTMEAMFAVMTNLEALYLDHNEIRSLPDNVTAVDFINGRDFRFSGNPWSCECEAQPGAMWLMKSSIAFFTQDNSLIKCTTPWNWAGFNMDDFDELYWCNLLSLYQKVFVGLASLVVFLSIGLIPQPAAMIYSIERTLI